MKKIWIVDDDDSLRWVLEKTFQKSGFDVASFEDAYHALESLDDVKNSDDSSHFPDIILSDINMPGLNGLQFLEKVHKVNANIPVIIMTAHSDLDSAVSSYSAGAFEYLPKPFDLDEAVQFAKRAISNETIIQSDQDDNNIKKSSKIIGESVAMQEVFRIIGRLSKSNISVLINGESGTGKELIANALHQNSPRQKKPFIALNMAAIPSDLIEAELFGHEKGAFTGATAQRKGRFEQANGGTLFLDEIGDMPYSTQTRLLRVLADGEFYRVGGQTPVKVDVRIIAATHQHLEKLVEEKQFREDLFYRLNVIRIHSPALRERPEDIPMLTSHFLTQIAKELGVPVKTLCDDAQNILNQYCWRGNVRQLENTCRYLTVMAASNEIKVEDLPQEITANDEIVHQSTHAKSIENTQPINTKDKNQDNANVHQSHDDLDTWQTLLALAVYKIAESNESKILDVVMPEFEATIINTVLDITNGRKGDAAELLGWGRNTLTRKIQELAQDNKGASYSVKASN